MSNTIDTNVVQLKFDNKQFEESCKESMSTLEKLKQKINDSSSGNALDGLGKGFNTDGITRSLDKINSHFSLLGIAALKVKSSIVDGFLGMAKTLATTVPSIIKEGGWTRAMNIEEAKFQLEGLKVAWGDVEGSIKEAVDGTAYGLDAAAKAASQFVASGVQVGDSMTTALRSISGVAAMTNAQYEEISPIFTTIAGQGKVMTMQLRQLENRGLNAAATLAEYFKGVTNGSIEADDAIKAHVAEITAQFGQGEAAVREMVTKGVINFNLFSNAMDNAFGEHAKDANRTFQGVTANIRAALKKIGADFASPIIEQDGPVVQALQRLRERINDVRASLGPLTDAWTSFVRHYGTTAANLLEKLDMSFMEHVVNGLVNLFKALLTVIRPIGYAFKDIFAPEAANTVMSISKAFESFTSKLVLSDRAMEGLRATVRGVLSIFSIFTTIIKQVLGALMGIKPETVNIGEILLTITGTIGNIITYISFLIKQMDIVGPAVSAIGTVLKVVISIAAIAIAKIIEFISYISKLEVTRNIISGLTIVVKALALGIGLLVVAIKNLITGGIQALPQILTGVANGFKDLFSWLSNIPIIQSAAEAINKLVEAIKNLLNPKVADNSGLEKTVTIVDDAVALAGPPQVKKVSTLEKAITALGNALIFVKNGLVTIFTPVKNFIQFLGAGGVAALAFTIAIGAIGVKLTKTMESVTKTFNATAGVLKTLGSDGVMGLIFGKKQQIKIPLILQIAAAIAVLAGSLKLLSTISSKKLKEVGIAMFEMAGGLVGLVTALTIAQKVLGKGETLQIAGVLITIAGSIGIMTASFVALNNLVSGGFKSIQGAVLVLVELSAIISVMAIALAKLAPQLSAGALSLIAMAVSIRILIGALNKLSDITVELNPKSEKYEGIWGKTGYLMAVAGGLVLISGIASKLGTNSLLGIMVALLSLKAIVPLANNVADAIKTSVFADAWTKLRDFFVNLPEGWQKALAGIAATVVIIGGIILAVVAFKKLVAAIKSIGSSLTKVGTETSKWKGISKALSRLSLVPVIVALTGMMVAIGAMVAILGNIKIANLNQAITIMAVVAAMFLTLAVVVSASKDAKPAAVIASMVGLTMMFSELIVLSLLIEQHYVGVIGACLVMAVVMHELTNVFDAVSEASEVSGRTLAAVGMIAGIVAELGIILYALSRQDWKSMAASGAAMTGTMIAFAKMLNEIGSTGQSFTKNKFLAIAECAALIPIIAGSIFLATLNKDWKSILAATLPMSAVMLAFGGMMQIIGKTKWNAGAWSAIGGIAISAVAIGAALALATLSHDWQSILAATVPMSAVMAVFGGMAMLLGKMNVQQAATAFVALLSVSVTALAVASSLMTLAQYPWDDIKHAVEALLITTGVLAGVGVLLGALSAFALPGAIALDLLAVAMYGISSAISTLINALTLFLPIADAFIGSVLGTLVSYSEQLPAVGTGLLQLAAGLAATGAAGMVLALGATGLLVAGIALPLLGAGLNIIANIDLNKLATGMAALASTNLLGLAVGLAAIGGAGAVLATGSYGLAVAGAALPSVVTALNAMQALDLNTIANGLASFVVPGLAMAAVGPAMYIGAAGIAVATVALTAFAIALKSMTSAMDPALDALDAFGSKSKESSIWGSDLVMNFVNGIKQKFSALVSTVQEMAQTVKDYVGFSEPDKGPLSDFHTYGGDMVDNFTTSMIAAFPELESGLNSMGELIKGDISDIDVSTVFSDMGIEGAEGLMSGFESMGTMDWFGDMGADAGHWFGENLNIALTEEMQRIQNKLINVVNEVNAINKKHGVGDGYRGVGMSMLSQANKDAKEAGFNDVSTWLHSTASAFDAFTDAAGGAGKASKSASKDVADLSNAFKELEKTSKVTFRSMMDNLTANNRATVEWAFDVRQLVSKGYDEATIEWCKKAGVAGHETVKALLSATEEEVPAYNAGVKQYLSLDEETEKIIAGDYGELGSDTASAFLAGFQEMYDTGLAKTIQDAVSPFDEFNKKVEMSAATLLSNMQSQLDGIREWGGMINDLMTRGLSEDALNYLMQLGPASYETVAAIFSMTDEQIQQFNTLWQEQSTLGAEIAGGINNQMNLVALNAVQGFTNGIDPAAAEQSLTEFGQAGVEALKTTWDTHSPSRVSYAVGVFITQGLGKGLDKTWAANVNMPINRLGNQAYTALKNWIGYDKGNELGLAMDQGLADGINAGASNVINAAVETALAAYNAAKAALDINSPSKIFRRLGLSVDEGFAQGIDWGTDMVIGSTQNLADNAIQMMNDIVKDIASNVNDFSELQPVIRPRLDLTEIQNGKSEVASLLNNPAYQMAASVASNMVASTVNSTDGTAQVPSSNQTIIFNQTNNSPKNIDPYESYRLNRLAAEQLKGAFR